MNGEVCWVELVSPDHVAGVSFYSEVLGLQAPDPSASFAFLVAGRAAVGAAYTAGEGHGWLPYFADVDAAAAAARGAGAGGTVVRPATPVEAAGWSALLADPEGVRAGIWQAGSHPGFGARGVAGTVCRVERHARSSEAVLRFYADTFGLERTAGPGGGYAWLDAGGRHEVGVVAMGDARAGQSPGWIVYFGVPDVPGAAAAAESAGGRVVHGPVESDEMGSFAVVQDPQGILFGVIRADAGGS